MAFSNHQKKLMELLLDQYENSKTYLGENQVTQSFAVLPEKVFEEYNSDFADIHLVHDFEHQMEELEKEGLVFLRRNRGIIEKITANPEKWQDYYKALHRSDKHAIQKQQIELYQSYIEKGYILKQFCREQIERLAKNKKAAYEMQEAECILKLCEFLFNNQEDILERELSIAVLGDSKLWEKKYRSKVCGLLRKYGDFPDLFLEFSDAADQEDKRETERILLEEYHVHANPAYVHMKGAAEITFDYGQSIKLNLHLPIAFSTETVRHVTSIKIQDKKVVTLENLTSFNRMEEEDTFMIFLSGYHNSVKQLLIRKIYQANSELEWYHFGDIDPDGFYIMENLRRGTGINFKPIHMDIDTLQKYKSYAKLLTDHDIRKAKALQENGLYCDIMEYMLNTRLKLEQEIVSWMEH